MCNGTRRGNKKVGHIRNWDGKTDEIKTSQASRMDHESKDNFNVFLKVEARNTTSKNKRIFYTYCKKPGHLKERYWLLHEKLAIRDKIFAEEIAQSRNSRRHDQTQSNVSE